MLYVLGYLIKPFLSSHKLENWSHLFSEKHSNKDASKTFAKVSDRDHWDKELDRLTVQNKFKDICLLESDNHIWNLLELRY